MLDDLDAPQFQQIINSNKYFIPPLAYRIDAAMSTGDYQTIVNLASLQLQKKKCSARERLSYLSLLARTYFELRDFEKLKVLFDKFKEYRAMYPSNSLLRTPNSAWSFYQYFLDQNYEACKTVCKERNLGLNPKAWGVKIKKLQTDFAYAVACYEMGEMDVAKSSFENILSYAPQMYVASISQKYLEAIENNQEPLISEVDVLPNDSYQIHNKKTAFKIRAYKILMGIGLSLIAISLALSAVSNHVAKKQSEDSNQIDTNFNDTLAKKYNLSATISSFNLEKEGNNVDSVHLIEVDGNFILVEVVSNKNGELTAVYEIENNIVLDCYYRDYRLRSGYYIGFMLSSTVPSVETAYYSLNFNHNGNTYWFHIDY